MRLNYLSSLVEMFVNNFVKKISGVCFQIKDIIQHVDQHAVGGQHRALQG